MLNYITRPADRRRTDPAGQPGPGHGQAGRTRTPAHEKAEGGGAPLRGRDRIYITINPPFRLDGFSQKLLLPIEIFLGGIWYWFSLKIIRYIPV